MSLPTQHFMDTVAWKTFMLVLWNSKINLLYGYHLNCILDNYLIQQYIPHYIRPAVVICVGSSARIKLRI